MSRTTLAALTLAATALAASGCGGSSSGGSSAATTGTTAAATTAQTAAVTPPAVTTVKVATGTPLTRAQLTARANAVCQGANAKLSAITMITTKEVERELPQEAIYRTVEAGELAKLIPPAALTRQWSSLINDFHLYAAYTQALVPYARAGNLRSGISLVRPAAKVQEQLTADARRIGIVHCATAQ